MAADCKAGRMGHPVAATAGLQGGVAGVLGRVQRCRDSTDAARVCLQMASVYGLAQSWCQHSHRGPPLSTLLLSCRRR